MQHCSFSGKCHFFFDVFSKHWPASTLSVRPKEELFIAFVTLDKAIAASQMAAFHRNPAKFIVSRNFFLPSPEMSTRAFDPGKVNQAKF